MEREYSQDYPLGGSVEPYDIWIDKLLMEDHNSSPRASCEARSEARRYEDKAMALVRREMGKLKDPHGHLPELSAFDREIVREIFGIKENKDEKTKGNVDWA